MAVALREPVAHDVDDHVIRNQLSLPRGTGDAGVDGMGSMAAPRDRVLCAGSGSACPMEVDPRGLRSISPRAGPGGSPLPYLGARIEVSAPEPISRLFPLDLVLSLRCQPERSAYRYITSSTGNKFRCTRVTLPKHGSPLWDPAVACEYEREFSNPQTQE